MTTSTKNAVLVNLFEHHKWSNLTIIDFCATLTDEQLALTGPGVYGNTSIRSSTSLRTKPTTFDFWMDVTKS